jgi:hypothetical protein
VDYKVVTQPYEGDPTDEYHINIYTRIESSRNIFYDCSFTFFPDLYNAPTIVPTTWKSFFIDLATPIYSGNVCYDCACVSANGTPCSPVDWCGFYTLGDYLAEYPNAIIGVGNGRPETIDLVTGETNNDYSGLEVCWDNVQIGTKNKVMVYDFEPVG